MSTRIVKLALITDFVCPSCFVLHHELISAMSYCKDTLKLPLEFQFQHIPFRLLGPTCLKPGTTIEKVSFYECHLGEEKAKSLLECVAKWGAEKNLNVTWKGVIGHSVDAHRLCKKAYELGGQEAQINIIDAIFKSNLIEAKDISDVDNLAEIAKDVGLMSKDKALKFLQSSELEAEVNHISDALRKKGITGVPLTVIDGKWAVSGGQTSEVFIQIFKKLAATTVGSSPSHLPGPAVPTQICASGCS